jgi:hypothetical protein
MKKKRTLYECSHARVNGERIKCRLGHQFSLNKDGGISLIMLARGEPLAFSACQGCSDFDCMGKPIPKETRGWLETLHYQEAIVQ